MFYYIIDKKYITDEMKSQTHSKNPRAFGDFECLKFDQEINCQYEYFTRIPSEINSWARENGFINDDII